MLLQTTIDITKHHPVVYAIALAGLIVQTAWNIWYTFTIVAVYVKYTPGSPSMLATRRVTSALLTIQAAPRLRAPAVKWQA